MNWRAELFPALTTHDSQRFELTVAHTHAHGDHIAGDGLFLGRPSTDLITPNVGSVISRFGFSDCPTTR